MPNNLRKTNAGDIPNSLLLNEIKKINTTNEEQAEAILKLINMLEDVKRKQEELEESLSIFKYGHEAIKQKHIEEYKSSGRLHEIDFRHRMLINLRNDPSLNKSEKEVFEFLTKLFDSVHHKFGEMPYNKLERQSPIAKSNLPRVLKNLVNKGKVTKRTDGYHVFYKANYKAYDDKKGDADKKERTHVGDFINSKVSE